MVSSEGYKATLEWGFWKFIKYLVVTALIVWFASYIATRVFNWDILLLNLHLANLWLIIPEMLLCLGVGYIMMWSRSSEKQKNKQKAQEYWRNVAKQGGEKE